MYIKVKKEHPNAVKLKAVMELIHKERMESHDFCKSLGGTGSFSGGSSSRIYALAFKDAPDSKLWKRYGADLYKPILRSKKGKELQNRIGDFNNAKTYRDQLLLDAIGITNNKQPKDGAIVISTPGVIVGDEHFLICYNGPRNGINLLEGFEEIHEGEYILLKGES